MTRLSEAHEDDIRKVIHVAVSHICTSSMAVNVADVTRHFHVL